MNKSTFFLHLPLLRFFLLMVCGGFFVCALAQGCNSQFRIKDHEYLPFISLLPIAGDQINSTLYVQSKRNLRVQLEVYDISWNNYSVEFLLGNDCLQGEWQWWALFVKVKHLHTVTDQSQVNKTYVFEVRTSSCVKVCIQTLNMQSLRSLDIWTSGPSEWRFGNPEGRCGYIPPWKTDAYPKPYPSCSSLSTEAASTSVPAGVLGGVGAGAILVVAVVVAVVAMKLKQHRQTPEQGAAVHP